MSTSAADSNAKMDPLPEGAGSASQTSGRVGKQTPATRPVSSPDQSTEAAKASRQKSKPRRDSHEVSLSEAHRSRAGTFWLDGGVLACACPACGAPMTIRLWLMMADCWRCGASLELTEEQEREALELLAIQDPPRSTEAESRSAPVENSMAAGPFAAAEPSAEPAAKLPPTVPNQPASKRPPQPSTSPTAPVKTATPTPRAPAAPLASPARQQQTQTPLARKSVPVPTPSAPTPPVSAPLTKAKPAPASPPVQAAWEEESRGGNLWRDLPAWLVSLVVHLILMLLLGMWTFDEEEPAPDLVLTVEIGPQRREGGLVETEVEVNKNEFDLPIEKEPANEQEQEALVRADEDARELRLDDKNSPKLSPIERVKEDLDSKDPYKRMHAARDPRVRSEIVTREGGTTLTEAAVARGLRWISQHQNEDGSWSIHNFNRAHDCQGACNGHAGMQSDSGGTALALMAMLGAGQTHQSGIYQDQVSHGLQWLINHQGEDGDLRANSRGNSGMYAHGQAAIVLCDAFKLTGEEALRAPAQKAIDFICEAQHKQGGWRYQPGEAGDLSVVGWQLMAMHSAKSAYLNVPKKHQLLASKFLDQVQADDSGGLYSYTPRSRPTPAMTAEGLLSRMYLGWDQRRPGLKTGVEFLVENHLPNARQRNMYYWYYGTQVMHHWGGEPWETWNRSMREVLVESQETSGHAAGSWNPQGFPHGGAGGRLYVTALATCTLEVYYRYAPLYRRIKLD